MPTYEILGLRIELPWALEKPPSTSPATVRVEICEPRLLEPDEEGASFRIRRRGTVLELTFGGVCTFLLPPADGGVLQVVPAPEADLREVRRQLLEHVIPRLLSRSHALVLHASSVVLGGGAVGFLAPSGSGKSTLALALARRGAAVLGDDSLVLDPGEPPSGVANQTAIAHPLWSSVRVHVADLTGALRAKFSSVTGSHQKAALREQDEPGLRFASTAHPLRALYVLHDASEVSIARIAPREAVLALLRESYHLEYDDMIGLSAFMSRVEHLGLTRRTFRLAYPRDFSRLEQVCAAVVRHQAEIT